MSESSEPSTFLALFNAALQDYKDETRNSLVDHPFPKQLKEGDSVESVSTILEEQHGSFVNLEITESLSARSSV